VRRIALHDARRLADPRRSHLIGKRLKVLAPRRDGLRSYAFGCPHCCRLALLKPSDTPERGKARSYRYPVRVKRRFVSQTILAGLVLIWSLSNRTE
jgi:hypothetical protein